MSESNIFEKLRKVQFELKAPKDQSGRFGQHRSAEKILEHVKPLLKKYELTLVLSDEIVNVGERNYVKATVAIGDAGSDDLIHASAYAWEGEISRGLDASQVTGVASSYARKYALGGLFAIDDNKDADSKEYGDEPKKPAVGSAKPEDEPATPLQKKRIAAYLQGQGVSGTASVEYLEENFGIIPGTVLTSRDAENILAELSS